MKKSLCQKASKHTTVIHKYLMKGTQYKTMFGLIKKIVIELLADTVNVSNHQKSIFLSSHIRNV